MTLRTLLPHVFTVSRPSRAHDGQGGFPQGFAPAGTIRGRLRPRSSRETFTADVQEAQVTHVLYAEAGADVRRGDVLTGAGLEVTVVAVREPSRAGAHIEVDVRAEQSEGDEA